MYKDFASFMVDLQAWSTETFGPKEKRGITGPLKHMEKELHELSKEVVGSPEWKEELIDLIFLNCDACWRAGVRPFYAPVELAWKICEMSPMKGLPTTRVYNVRDVAMLTDGTVIYQNYISSTLQSNTLRIFSMAQRGGMTWQDVMDTLWKKMQKNKSRKWPTPTSDAPVEHVRD